MRTQDERDEQTLDIAVKVFGVGAFLLLIFLLFGLVKALIGL